VIFEPFTDAVPCLSSGCCYTTRTETEGAVEQVADSDGCLCLNVRK